ncbi:MAG: GHKL domain-containing protein [Ruminococcus albus]|nr:GHKL domain-containing protein [Ruminococcus albus]
MTQILTNTGLYIIELIKLLLFAFGISSVKIKSPKLLAVSAAASVFAVMAISSVLNIYDYAILYGVFASFACIFALEKKRSVLFLLFEYLTICILDITNSNIVMLVTDLQIDRSSSYHEVDFMINSLTIPILLILRLVKSKYADKFPEFRISARYIVLMSIGQFLFMVYISSLTLFSFTGGSTIRDRRLTVIACLSCVVFVVVVFLLFFHKSNSVQKQKEIEYTRDLLRWQDKYYTYLLQKEEETKRFRHDIKNHLYAINTLLEYDQYDELDRYLKDLQIKMTPLNSGIHTGVRLVDVILHELSEEHSDVTVEWEGQLSENTNIAMMDMCTVFSNLLSNAFEAAQKCDDKWVKAKVSSESGALYVMISNSTSHELKYSGGAVATTNTGSGHGYGIRNVEDVVRKYSGKFSIKCSDGAVSAEAVLLN